MDSPHQLVETSAAADSAIWRTDVPAVFTAFRQVLRPGGRFVFNIGGGFTGARHPVEHHARIGPSLNTLIRQVAARDYGYPRGRPQPSVSGCRWRRSPTTWPQPAWP